MKIASGCSLRARASRFFELPSGKNFLIFKGATVMHPPHPAKSGFRALKQEEGIQYILFRLWDCPAG